MRFVTLSLRWKGAIFQSEETPNPRNRLFARDVLPQQYATPLAVGDREAHDKNGDVGVTEPVEGCRIPPLRPSLKSSDELYFRLYSVVAEPAGFFQRFQAPGPGSERALAKASSAAIGSDGQNRQQFSPL